MKPELPAHKSLAHYRIVSKLGAGGMGEVWLAEDTGLERKVALKLLPPEFTTDADRLRRFVQEAKAASALNHPNIITIHEIGVAQGAHYIATEFIDGQTLRARLQAGALPLAEALDAATQIASALAAAHAAGIIHRDIKPENVMVRKDGIVKVLDFGLAKLTEVRIADRGLRIEGNDEDADTLIQNPRANPPPANPQSAIRNPQLTDPGAVMGTPQYMSPEQARGQKADARTDIFSLGVVLYEMLAGQPPFAGVNALDVIGAILNQEPAPLSAATIPAELQRIVAKALRKDRDERYQSVKDLLLDLNELREELAFAAKLSRTAHASGEPAFVVPPSGGAARQPSQPPEGGTTNAARRRLALILSAAVLVIAAVAVFFFYFQRQPALTDKDTILLADFTNTTGDAVFDGTLKQALAVHLGQSPFLNLLADERVRETLRLMNKPSDERITPAIGREICQRQGLKALLTGSIASLGRNYVINLEAINAQTGDVLAREQSEADGKESVLKTLGAAATRLREKLGESLGSIQKFDAQIEQATTSSLAALRAFSQGNEQRDQGKYISALPFFRRATELDSNFALAWANLALAQNYVEDQEAASTAVQRAFNLRERVSERERFFIIWCYHLIATRDVDKEIESLEQWKRTYPREAMPYYSLAGLYSAVGQYEQAVEAGTDAIRLNPNFARAHSRLAMALVHLNRFDEAKAVCERALQQKLDYVGIHTALYYVAFIQGDEAAMKREAEWAVGKVEEGILRSAQAEAVGWTGRLRQSREITNQNASLYLRRNWRESAGQEIALGAVRAAVYGNCQQARADLARVAAIPRTPFLLWRIGITRTLCGDIREALLQADEMSKRFPKDVDAERFVPLLRAAIEIQRGHHDQALQMLQAISRYESGIYFWINYLRGRTYLAQRKSSEAATEFQKILDHRGWSPTSALYVPAHLGLARALVLQGDTVKAKQRYDEFFRLWKDADADLPLLIEAKKEYAKLQ